MTQLPNPWISNSVDGSPPSPTDTAVASSDLQPRATAESFIEPSMTMEVPSEASAPAPTKNPDADALGKCNCAHSHCDDFDRPDCKAKAAGLDPWPEDATDHIHEIFHWVRKLMKQPPRFVLDEAEFMADVEEEPLFIRDGAHLRRWEA